ncbi:MAG: dUTPase [Sulfurovum sp. FS08-3]|nr:MAG: dUTPase [Sulfurovum sp. FS08-3]
MNPIHQMLQLQQQLNDATNGKGWESGITKNAKEINWRRCIYMESCELIDCYPWKHWKSIDAPANTENAQIEVVDIWHFVMSLALEDFKINVRGDTGFLSNQIQKLESYSLFVETQTINSHHKEIIVAIEDMLRAIFAHKSSLKIIEKFFVIASGVGLNLERLYQLYVGKNILNQFRQDHGYKSGEYIKVWNGLEDNEVMHNLLQTAPQIKPDELYQELKRVYESL